MQYVTISGRGIKIGETSVCTEAAIHSFEFSQAEDCLELFECSNEALLLKADFYVIR
jgi:hypothetical protein